MTPRPDRASLEWLGLRLSSVLANASLRWGVGTFLVARIALTLWSIVVILLAPVQVQNLDLFGTPVLATFDLSTSARHVYSRELDGVALSFRLTAPGQVTDAQTGSVWSLPDGRAVSGKYAGTLLAASRYTVEDVFPYRGVAPESNPLLALWQRFDANWYVAIAQKGYGNIPGDVHFPPLFPVLIRLVGALTGDLFVAGLLISNLATMAALVLMCDIARRLGDDSAAKRSIVYLMLFPTAFFLFSAYTESLFLLFALLALSAMQKREWLAAGLWTCFAMLTRLQGIALVVPLVYLLWTVRPIDQKLARVVALALPAGAMVSYLLIRAWAGDSSVIPTSEPSLFARLAPPWENYVYAIQTLASGRFAVADVLNFVVTTLFVVLAIGVWREMPIEYALFAAASLVVLTVRIVDTQPLNSMSRYAITLFPAFVLLGRWGKNPWVQRAVVYPSVALALYCSAQFFWWGWVG